MFNPKPEYEIVYDSIPVKDFKDYWTALAYIKSLRQLWLLRSVAELF